MRTPSAARRESCSELRAFDAEQLARYPEREPLEASSLRI